MGSDAIANVPLSAYAKDSSKKKKGTRLTQLKQNKLDVRREPWLFQVKNKGCKVETNGSCGASPSSVPNVEGRKPQGNLSTKTIGDEHHDILGALDSEEMSWMSSSIDRTWGRGCSGKDFSGSGSSCSGSCSSSGSEEDWEAMADALNAATNNRSSDLDQHTRPDPLGSPHSSNSPNMTKNTSTLKTVAVAITNRRQGNSKAWSPDDVFRPRSLPSLSKQQQNPTQDSERCFSQGPPTILSWQRVVSQQPSSCPICCEDFDVTDSSFRPCPCGFQLCLFCHKKILEVDGRCPGCRKQYDLANPGGESVVEPVAFQMNHSGGRKKRF